MVVVRLQRLGTKKAPHHRIVVTERQWAQSSRVLEVVGYYDPSFEPPKFTIKEERVQHWVSLGAQVSEALAKLRRHFAKRPAAATK